MSKFYNGAYWEIKKKIKHNSGCMQDRVVIFDSKVGFSGTAYLMASFINLPPDYPCCHGNEIWDKIGYNSACIRDIMEIFAYNRGFRGRAIE